MSRGWIAVGLVLVGLGLFAAILVLVGPGAVWRQMQALGPLGFLAMLAGDLLATALWAASWGVLLWAFGVRLPWRAVAGVSMAGFAVSYLTPVAYLGGEPVRAWLTSRKTGRPLTTIYATLLLDRLLAGLCLVTFAVLGGVVALTGPVLGLMTKVKVAAGLGVVSAAVALGVVSFARNYHWLSQIVAALGRLKPAWRRPTRWAEKVREMEDDVHAAFSRYLPYTVLALVLELLSFLCNYLRPLLFFYFTEGRWFSLADLALYFNLNAILTTLLWLTPAGMGTAEGGRVGILSLVGISAQGGVAFSLTIRFLELLVVGTGLVYLSREGLLYAVRGTREGHGRSRVRSWLGMVRGALELGSLYFYGWVLGPRWLPRFFARLYRRPDPWGYETSAYEQRKYDLTLAILPQRADPARPPYDRILEVGCSEGLFTARLAREGWGREIVGVDFMPAALARARARCADLPGVRFLHLDITQEAPGGVFDLVFCAEVLYYLGPLRRLEAVADRLCRLLAPEGHLVLVNPWPASSLLHRPFRKRQELVVVREHVERDSSRPYVITCLARTPRR
ncbi:flippase-like domain-containing protein [Candidatus Bipolaricaulota bacterium]|nr:flippase-like domain-containing protein [Candidatus Bipolaricaulota bacterium]